MTNEKKRRYKYPNMPTKRDVPLMLYDMDINDLKERALKALPFNDGFEVMDFLGHEKTVTITRMIDKTGKYVEGKDGKKWAIRTKKVKA